MARRVQRFEDLIAWQKARAFAHQIHIVTRAKGFDWGLALDCGYIDEGTFSRLYEQGAEVARVVGALRASVARRIAEDEAK